MSDSESAPITTWIVIANCLRRISASVPRWLSMRLKRTGRVRARTSNGAITHDHRPSI